MGQLVSVDGDVPVPSQTQNVLIPIPPPTGSGIIFFDDFRSGDLSGPVTGAGSWFGSRRITIVNTVAQTGQYCAQFSWPAGTGVFSELSYDLGATYPNIWMKFSTYYPTGNDGLGNKYTQSGSENNKFFRAWGNSPRTSYTNTQVGLGASHWGISGGNSNTKIDVKYKNPTGTCSTSKQIGPVNGGWTGVGNNDRGRWIETIFHMVIPQDGSATGLIESWQDGQLVDRLVNQQIGGSTSCVRGITAGYLFGWNNASWPHDTLIYVDNVTFSTESLL